MVRSANSPNWRLQTLLEKILVNLSTFENFTYKDIYREANTTVDVLSKVASNGIALSWWADDLNI